MDEQNYKLINKSKKNKIVEKSMNYSKKERIVNYYFTMNYADIRGPSLTEIHNFVSSFVMM